MPTQSYSNRFRLPLLPIGCFAIALIPFSTRAGAQVQTHAYQGIQEPTHLNFDGSVIGGIDYSSSSSGHLAVWNRFQPGQLIAPLEWDSYSGLYDGSVMSLSDNGDQALVYLPSLPAWGGIWNPSGGLTPLPPHSTLGFALMTSGDGTQTFGFSDNSELLRWTGTGTPQVMCGTNCTVFPQGVTTDGTAVVGYGGNSGSIGLYYWSAGSGIMLVQPNVALGGRYIDIAADGSGVYGITGSQELFRWSPAVGQFSLGKPTWADSLQNVWVNDSGDRVFVQAYYTLGGQSRTKPAMWDSATGWHDLVQYWAAQGAPGFSDPDAQVLLRHVSRNGKAAIVFFRAQGATSWIRAVVYFDGPAPGTIGGNYCGPAEAAFFNIPPSIYMTGSDSLAANAVTLHGQNLPLAQFAIALNSRGQGFVANPAGSLGALCLGGGAAIGRHNRVHEIQMTGADGSFSLDLDLTDLPSPHGPVSALPGETWNFQVWSRMPASGGPPAAFSDAVSIQFQ